MAQRKASSKPAGPATVTSILYKAFRKRLTELGCVFCPECYAYMYPDHVHGEHRQEAA